MKFITLGLTVLLLIISLAFKVDNPNEPSLQDEKIIGFDPLKCGNCWGWIIKVGNDTIKTRDNNGLNISQRFGHNFDSPVNILITVGDSINESSNNYPYYNIICIRIC